MLRPFACWLLCLCPLVVSAADPIVAPNAQLEELWNEGEFTEGVAARADGLIFFSDIAIGGMKPGRIMTFDPATKTTSVFVADSGQSNGIFFTPEGKLLAACGAVKGHRAVCEFSPKGEMSVVAGKFNGKVFNSPNDLAVHPKGWVYFSDPRYVGSEPLELDLMSVYRINPDGSVVRATNNISKPNGVIISPDGKTLYVAETDNGATGLEPEGTKPKPPRFTLNSFPIADDGSLGEKTVIVNFGDEMGIDGMTVDTTGRVYAAIRKESRHGIAVYSPQGEEVAFIKTEPLPTNCTFGTGKEANVLYITAGEGLYRIATTAKGYHP
ncbi:SMP-30/gluconolactonase/LRE family protein [bacterium]|nr:SMP-30/gluconolactonase/LRE family protein [bacterium]